MGEEKILIVDDDARNIEFLRDSLLAPRGYIMLCAADGEQALRLALEENPDLILMDLQMPKMDGIEVLEALRKNGREVPTILITAHGSEHVAVQAFRLGVRDYFPKPFKVQEVLAAVDRSLIEARLRREKEELTGRIEAVNRQLGERVRELGTLYDISKAVASVLDVDELLTRIVEASRYVTRADQASLFLHNEERDEILLRATQSSEDSRARLMSKKVNDPVVSNVIANGEPMSVASRQTTGFAQRHLALAAPLSPRDRTIGALCAYKRETAGQFTKNDLYLLSALADHAAIAIENARLYEAAQRELDQRRKAEAVITQLAYHDSLTGLPNRMLFSDRLKVALAQARRHNYRLAVMMMDLDHFKSVNDNLGHAVGDKLLQAVGDRLLMVLRESDTICRLGGDEFLLLLGEMKQPEFAERAAERVLDTIRKPFVIEQHRLPVTTSIGIALYPDDGQNEDTLVRRADLAMYRAKERGRDNYQRISEQTQNTHSAGLSNPRSAKTDPVLRAPTRDERSSHRP
jgi:diguanylate cyclase (GGDEF)-like protein